ncbi:MAG: hypothetical protein PHS37_07225, partial [Candidatus Omnitrophica bacterium]|nr:hypothetical protein [Candidatus Omnitrophota bacterium]
PTDPVVPPTDPVVPPTDPVVPPTDPVVPPTDPVVPPTDPVVPPAEPPDTGSTPTDPPDYGIDPVEPPIIVDPITDPGIPTDPVITDPGNPGLPPTDPWTPGPGNPTDPTDPGNFPPPWVMPDPDPTHPVDPIDPEPVDPGMPDDGDPRGDLVQPTLSYVRAGTDYILTWNSVNHGVWYTLQWHLLDDSHDIWCDISPYAYSPHTLTRSYAGKDVRVKVEDTAGHWTFSNIVNLAMPDLKIPELKYTVDGGGNFHLTWTEFPDAASYAIYLIPPHSSVPYLERGGLWEPKYTLNYTYCGFAVYVTAGWDEFGRVRRSNIVLLDDPDKDKRIHLAYTCPRGAPRSQRFHLQWSNRPSNVTGWVIKWGTSPGACVYDYGALNSSIIDIPNTFAGKFFQIIGITDDGSPFLYSNEIQLNEYV